MSGIGFFGRSDRANSSGRQRSIVQRSHNTVIFAIVLLTFVVSNLLFWRINTGVLRRSIESDTNLYTSFLADEIEDRIPDSVMFTEDGDDGMSQEILSVENRIDDRMENTSDAWIIGGDGISHNLNGRSENVDFFKIEGAGADIEKGVDALEKVKEKGSYTFWTGPSDIILLRQRCVVIRSLYDGDLYLAVVNHADAERALQRRQFAILAMIDILLMILMIVLIVNNNERYHKQIVRFATTDELTGLANRKSFTTEFNEYMRTDHPDSSVFLLDIDFFKQINDNYGHAAGDDALRLLAGEIGKMASGLGGFAGRWGGDEFIGVLPVTAERAHEELSNLCRIVEALEPEGGFRMTISAGIVAAGDETDLSRLTEKADLALYESKENGRNQATNYGTLASSGDQPAENDEAASYVEAALAAGETMKISVPAPGDHSLYDREHSGRENERRRNTEAMPALRGSFRERLAGYVREKLIMSTILGVRWMAPFIAAGGILIAFAFLIDAMSVDMSMLNYTERASLGSITPAAATLKEIGGTTFNFMLPVFAGFMAYGIAGEAAFMAGFAGGYMTIGSNSGFVGAMVAGFAAGVITNELKQFTGNMPSLVRKAAPIIIIPVFTLLLMQLICMFIITPVATEVGKLFTGLLEAAVGASHVTGCTLAAAMMPIDMGGIINKVAYNYGVNGLAEGRTDIMAAVMIGGMVPPIGIFISTVLFKGKFTQAELDRGPGALFMGLSFITEGALPYVFTDVVRVIPSCMLGSAIAGLLSGAFGCTLPAPHGGVFVFPVMGHTMMYIVALAAGSFVAAVTLGAWKKPVAGSELPEQDVSAETEDGAAERSL